jgi:hypothetical protein
LPFAIPFAENKVAKLSNWEHSAFAGFSSFQEFSIVSAIGAGKKEGEKSKWLKILQGSSLRPSLFIP